MQNLNFESRDRGEEILYFRTGDEEYRAFIAGDSIKISRCKSIQPPICDHEDFFTYLWAQSHERFFLFRQRFEKGAPGPWEVWQEIVPQDKDDFFNLFLPFLEENLDSHGEKLWQ